MFFISRNNPSSRDNPQGLAPWFHGDMTDAYGRDVLQKAPPKSFLVRIASPTKVRIRRDVLLIYIVLLAPRGGRFSLKTILNFCNV